MAYFDDQEIETLPSPPITTATTATTTITPTPTVNIHVPLSILVKSLFALAVFLGLSLNQNPVPSNTLSSDPACVPTGDIAVSLVFSQFYAFTCFIFSAITEFALKIRNASGFASTHHDVNNIKGSTRHFSRCIMLVSNIGFFIGVSFLLSSISDLAEMKLGTYPCGSSSVTLAVVAPLAIFPPLSLIFFMCSSLSAFKAA